MSQLNEYILKIGLVIPRDIISTLESLPTREGELRAHIAHWKHWADVTDTDAAQQLAIRMEKSIGLEIETGKPHCPCCLKPTR